MSSLLGLHRRAISDGWVSAWTVLLGEIVP